MLARMRDASNNLFGFRSPVDGSVMYPAVAKEGDQIAANQTVARLLPDPATLIDALRALAYIGTKDDLQLVDEAARMDPSPEVTKQSEQTTKAIRSRSDK